MVKTLLNLLLSWLHSAHLLNINKIQWECEIKGLEQKVKTI